MNWIREAASSPQTGRLSSSRVIALVAGLTLSFSTVLLTIGSFWKQEMLSTLAVFGPFLATLAGANYMTNRITGQKGKE